MLVRIQLPSSKNYEHSLYLPHTKTTSKHYMSDLDGNGDRLFESFKLEVMCDMDDPPAEVLETSWRRARGILDEAGPEAGILLLVGTQNGDDLASKVVLSSGYQRIPVQYIGEMLEAHLGAL